MTWPDAVEDAPADDHTREARALYEQVRREACVPPPPDPPAEMLRQGPTAAYAEHQRQQASIAAGRVRLAALVHDDPAGTPARRPRRAA